MKLMHTILIFSVLLAVDALITFRVASTHTPYQQRYMGDFMGE